MISLNKIVRRDTRVFVIISFLLALVGLIFIYSASSVYALEKFGSANYFFKRQLAYLVVSIVGFCFFATMPITFWKRYTPYFFIISLAMTILTFVSQFSMKIHGSSRWLCIAGVSIQPSEILKIFLFMYI